MWQRRVCVVADDADWRREAGVRLEKSAGGGRPELLAWSDARRLRGPLGALVARGPASSSAGDEAFQRWASRGWQPCTVVCVRPVRGRVALESRLADLRYRHLVVGEGEEEFWERLTGRVEEVLRRRLWLVGEIAAATGCDDPVLVEALAVPLSGDGSVPSVESWVARSSVTYRELGGRLAEAGLPAPKPTLDVLRLCQILACAGRLDRSSYTLTDLAARFGFPSGRSLGRWVRRVAGAPFRSLVEEDLRTTVRALVARWRDGA